MIRRLRYAVGTSSAAIAASAAPRRRAREDSPSARVFCLVTTKLSGGAMRR